MKTKPKKVKKENKQIVEIHIYVHTPYNPSGTGGGLGTFYNQCTCGTYKGNGAPCPIHPNG